MLMNKSAFNKMFKEMVTKYRKKAEHDYDMEVVVRFINDRFEEEHYVEVALYSNEEEMDELTVQINDYKSQGKNYTLAKEIQGYFNELELLATFKKEIYA